MRSTKPALKDQDLLNFLKEKYCAQPAGRREIIVSHVITLWKEFRPFANLEFYNHLMSGNRGSYQQRYWEMLLARHLKSAGHKIRRKSSGPDFEFQFKDKTVWVEAVAPDRDQDIDLYYQRELREGGGYHTADIFQLRWTQAINDKVEKFAKYLCNGMIGEDDICVIAINSGLLGSSGMTGKSDYPILIDVVFGAGAKYVRIDRNSMTIVEQAYEREPFIMKRKEFEPDSGFEAVFPRRPIAAHQRYRSFGRHAGTIRMDDRRI